MNQSQITSVSFTAQNGIGWLDLSVIARKKAGFQISFKRLSLSLCAGSYLPNVGEIQMSPFGLQSIGHSADQEGIIAKV